MAPSWACIRDQAGIISRLVDFSARIPGPDAASALVAKAEPDGYMLLMGSNANSVNGRPDNPHSPFRGYFHQLKELKLRYPRLKILISLEGAPAGFMEGAKPQNRRAFER